MSYLRQDNPGLRFFLHYWQQYCRLEDWHISWARQHLHVRTPLRKGTLLYQEGEKQTNVYLVAKGAIARIEYTEAGARRIRSVALPGMALMTTGHLHSRTDSKGDIIVLHAQTMVLEIPYRPIIEVSQYEMQAKILQSVLTTKKTKQATRLSRVLQENDPIRRYMLFNEELPELRNVLTQVEQAQLLSISRVTVQRAQYFLLTGRTPRF